MRKIGLFAVAAALSVAAVGGWIATTTHARLDVAKDARIDPVAIMVNADALPAHQVVDFSLVFE